MSQQKWLKLTTKQLYSEDLDFYEINEDNIGDVVSNVLFFFFTGEDTCIN